MLGDTIERYMFISVERYGLSWMPRPVVVVLFVMAMIGLLRPFLEDVKAHGGVKRMLTDFGRPRSRTSDLFYVFMIVVLGAMLIQALAWNFRPRSCR